MLINFNHIKTFYNALIQKMKGFRGNWEQNDDTADDYIKNRPFYSEIENIIVLPETTIQIKEDNYIELDASITFVEGQTYTVIYDNNEYQCVCWCYDDWDALCLGNGSLLDSSNKQGNGEPFCFDNYEGYETYFNASDTNPHTISISIEGEVIHKLDKKFIDMPDGIITEDNIEEFLAPVAFTNDYESLDNKPTIYTDVVRYGASQSLTEDQRAQARANIDASNFSGSYNDLTNKPNYAVLKDVANSYDYIVQLNNGALVIVCKCQSIQITTMPTRTEYIEGEIPDLTGLTLSLTRQDGTIEPIEDYTYTFTYTDNLLTVILQYLEFGETYTASFIASATPFDPVTQLVDFEYTIGEDGTYTLTAWKQTLNGESSTEMVVPNNSLIKF